MCVGGAGGGGGSSRVLREASMPGRDATAICPRPHPRPCPRPRPCPQAFQQLPQLPPPSPQGVSCTLCPEVRGWGAAASQSSPLRAPGEP